MEERVQELENQIRQLNNQLRVLQDFIEQKKRQQISFPIDETSKNIIFDGSLIGDDLGNGSTALTQVYTDSNSDTHTGPKAYVDTRLIKIGTVTIEVPYLSIT